MYVGKFPSNFIDEAESITNFSTLISLGSIPDRVYAGALKFSTSERTPRHLYLWFRSGQSFDDESPIMETIHQRTPRDDILARRESVRVISSFNLHY
jgi:hypothetical protein